MTKGFGTLSTDFELAVFDPVLEKYPFKEVDLISVDKKSPRLLHAFAGFTICEPNPETSWWLWSRTKGYFQSLNGTLFYLAEAGDAVASSELEQLNNLPQSEIIYFLKYYCE